MHGYRDGEIKGVAVVWDARYRKRGELMKDTEGRHGDKKVLMSLIHSR